MKRTTKMELTTAAMMTPVPGPSSGSGTVPVTTRVDDLVLKIHIWPITRDHSLIKKFDDFVKYIHIFIRDHFFNKADWWAGKIHWLFFQGPFLNNWKQIDDLVKYIDLYIRDHFCYKADWRLCKIPIRFINQGPFLNKEDWWMCKIHWPIYHLFIRDKFFNNADWINQEWSLRKSSMYFTNSSIWWICKIHWSFSQGPFLND